MAKRKYAKMSQAQPESTANDIRQTTAFNLHLGSSLNDLLEADGVLAKARADAVKIVIDWQDSRTASGHMAAVGNGVLKLVVILETDEDDWVVASCPTLPGCHSQGRTKDEALANIREAVEGYLASMGTCRSVDIARRFRLRLLP